MALSCGPFLQVSSATSHSSVMELLRRDLSGPCLCLTLSCLKLVHLGGFHGESEEQLSRLSCSIGCTLGDLSFALMSSGLVVNFLGDSGHVFDCLRTSAKMGIRFLSWTPVIWPEPLRRQRLHAMFWSPSTGLGHRCPMHVMAKLVVQRLVLL